MYTKKNSEFVANNPKFAFVLVLFISLQISLEIQSITVFWNETKSFTW